MYALIVTSPLAFISGRYVAEQVHGERSDGVFYALVLSLGIFGLFSLAIVAPFYIYATTLEDSDKPVPPGGNQGDYLVGANDLRRVADELWKAGAEAVAINDERITTSTAIIDIGGSVLVNAAYLAGPYQVSAIGPPELFSHLSASPGFQEFVSTRRGSFGIGMSWAEPAAVDIPAFAGSVNLSESRAVPSPSSSDGPAAPGQGSAQP
jgi:hypothetical protein